MTSIFVSRRRRRVYRRDLFSLLFIPNPLCLQPVQKEGGADVSQLMLEVSNIRTISSVFFRGVLCDRVALFHRRQGY